MACQAGVFPKGSVVQLEWLCVQHFEWQLRRIELSVCSPAFL